MAMTYDAASARSGARPTGAGLVVVMDRSESFRQARRHSQLVSILRLALPAMGAGLVVVYAVALMGAGGFSAGLSQVALPRITPKDLSMQNPNYDGVTEDGGTYRVAAARARQELDRTDVILLEEITGELIAKDKTSTRLAAARGTFNHKDNVLELHETIEIRGDNGFSADLTSATVLTRQGRISSNDPVSVGFPAGSVKAKRLEIRQKVREVTFVDEVVARLVPPARKPEAAAVPAPSPPPQASLLGASDGPVDITAARLDILDNEHKAIFTGSVQASQAGATLATPEMTVFYDSGPAAGGASPVAAGGKLSRIEAKGPFVMTRGANDRVTGDRASFDAIQSTALLDGGIVMTSGTDRRITADRVELDQKSDSAVLTGVVVLTQGETVLKGRRLAVDRKNGRSALTAPPMAGSGPGRITAHFVQKNTGAKKTAAPPPAATGAALAQFRTAPDAPLDVEADSLDVDDTARVAVFRGDVVTRQGEVTMRSTEVRAHYTGSARLADVGAAPATDAPGAASELARIDANGGVVVTTVDNRKVTGDWAKYDASSGSITVGGEVELSQAGSVVRGKRLVIDVRTGKATIDTSTMKTVEKPAGGGWSTEAEGRSTGGRPSAIFFPDELRKAQGGGASKKATGPGTSGWSSQTLPPATSP